MLETIMEKLKSEGLEVTEDIVVKIVRAVFKQIKEKSLDDMVDMLEAKVLEQVDKIDGKDDAEY